MQITSQQVQIVIWVLAAIIAAILVVRMRRIKHK